MSLIDQLISDVLNSRSPDCSAFSQDAANDRWNASRLLAAFGSDLAYVTSKDWGVWDGARYDFSDGRQRAMLIAERLQDLVTNDAGTVTGGDFTEEEIDARLKRETATGRPKFWTREACVETLREERIRAMKKHASKCGNVDTMKKALEIAQGRRRVPIEDLDADPNSFVCPNGRIDLRLVAASELSAGAGGAEAARIRKSWLLDHDRSSHPTKCAGVAFDPNADCPRWRSFLALILPDRQIRDCFQRSMGAALFGRNEAQVALMLRGSGGNGKSTAVSAIAHVFGETNGYAVPCKIEMFLATQNQSASQATPEEVDLPGARLMIASEPAATDELSSKKIKALTGGDRRPARALNMPQFYYRPTGFPILSFNRTPRIKDEDEGTRRRLVFFPFEVNLRALPPARRRNPAVIEAELRSEGPGILNWLLDGYREFTDRLGKGIGAPPGIDPPESMQRLKDTLLEQADPVGEFIKDSCVRTPESLIRCSDFYRQYEMWCDEVGAALYGKQAVTRTLIEKGHSKRKTGGIWYWAGFGWQDSVRQHG